MERFESNVRFYWRQITHTIPRAWKEIFLVYGYNMNNLLIKEHHLIKKHQIYCLEKVNSRELYNMQIILKVKKPTAQTYFEKNFWNPVLEWKDILTKGFTNLEKSFLTLNFLHGRTLKPNPYFSFLYKSKLSLNAATTFFAKRTNNPSNFITEHHLWIYWW